jgi:YD repeat-containing protein
LAQKNLTGKIVCLGRIGAASSSLPNFSELIGTAMLLIALCVMQARSEEQTRFYGPDGKSIGTAVPLGNGSVRYYDARGNSVGTSTTTGNTTRFYDAGGRSMGSATGPVGPRPIGRTR